MEVNEEGHVSKKDIPDTNGIMRGRDSPPNTNNVEFNGSIYMCKVNLRKWKKEYFNKKKEENLAPGAL